eukprot:TRINITY_DN29180_c0_g1_i1.p1 TRINITY_DN29180_c0_g1~~TRINITY_DN29180_c0_g1_i1.p1  ORF type:complete len:490 (+),score=52.46 TRINITY_DN29180_c0_g1_i1:200-1471(+)
MAAGTLRRSLAQQHLNSRRERRSHKMASVAFALFDLTPTMSVTADRGRTPIKEVWRWQLFQIPDNSFQFPSGQGDEDSTSVAELKKDLPLWIRYRDKIFEENGLFCNGRWLGVQVLQSTEDLFYFQHVLTRLRPRVVIEIGTFRGGFAFFAASILSQLGLHNSRVVTLDTFDMESNFYNLDTHPLCPVCADCVKAYETDLWRKHVFFFQGNSLRLADQVHRYVDELRADDNSGPVLVTMDAQHSYDGTLTELHLYGGLVDVGSYVVLQDARLDYVYGRAGPLVAGSRLLEEGSQWVWDRRVDLLGPSHHLWFRRVAQGPPVRLSFGLDPEELVEQTPFRLMHENARCAGSTDLPIADVESVDSDLVCQALCMRVPERACRFLSFQMHPFRCSLWRSCPRLEAAPSVASYEFMWASRREGIFGD